MSDSKKKFDIKPLIYGFLSFVLGFVIFLLSICLVLRLTFFSRDFMLDSMANSGYYEMVKDELNDKLKDLGHASGLPDEFFDEFVGKLDIIDVERNYVAAFYTGESTLIDTDKFKQQLLDSINTYIEENNIDKEKANENSVLYLVDRASSIYVNAVTVSFFSVLANYIKSLDGPLTMVTIGLAVVALIIAVIIYFTNVYKHRRYRYLTYGLGAGFLSVTVIPIVIFLSGIIPKVNISTRSLYNLFVAYFNTMFMYFWIFAAVLLLLTIISFVLYRQKYLKAINH